MSLRRGEQSLFVENLNDEWYTKETFKSFLSSRDMR